MNIGIAIEETWDFFYEIYKELKQHHQVMLFERRTINPPIFYERTNRFIFNRDFKKFLTQNDVVFFEWSSELLQFASHLPKTCGIVTRLHRYEMYQWIEKINWENVDGIIVVSDAKKKEFIKKFPNTADKVTVFYEAVSLEKFAFQPKDFAGDIGILCHLTPRKRVYELILDFYELTMGNSTLHLHIGGDPHHSHLDYLDAMQNLVQELGIQDQVTFYGPVTNTANWYQNIDIFISNSYSEGLQVALLEAMASGCYCLSHYWAGVDELLPRENLYYTGNELKVLIKNFLQLNGEEQFVLKKQMREIVSKQADIDIAKTKIRKLIEEVGENSYQR